MADAMTPEEIREYIDGLQRALNEGRISAKEFADGMKDATVGIKNYTRDLKQNSLQFKASMQNLVGSMKDGAGGASQYNDALSSGAKYVAHWLSSKGPWGIAGSMLVKGATAYVAAVNKQSDALFKSYQQISRAGATGAGGITQLYTNMQKFGYGIKELDSLAALVQENSSSLALLGGTVMEGTQTFGNLSKGIRDSRIGFEFEKMGISVDNMNRGIAAYLRIQTITGQAQKKTQDELRAGAEAYILEQEKLTKLTGLSAQEQAAARESALREQQFGARIRSLRRRAEESGDKALADEADKREKLNLLLTKETPAFAKGFRDITSGYYTEDALKFQRALPTAARAIQEGADAATIQAAIVKDSARTLRANEEAFAAGAGEAIYGPFAELQILSGEKALAEREKIAEKEMGVTDKATASMTEMIRAQRQTRDSLQDLVQIGIRPVTATMAGLAKTMSGITGVGAKAATTVTGGAGGTGASNAPVPSYSAARSAGPTKETTPASAPTKPTKETTPEPSVVKPVGGGKPTSQGEFYNNMYNMLLTEAKKQGVPNPEAVAKLGAAQASLETGYGKHKVGNNYFGIKARGGTGGVGAQTQEFVGGKMVTMNQQFRGYGSQQESAADYIRFLKENPRYKSVLGAGSAEEAIAAQGRTGYATDPQYASKLAGIYSKYGVTAPTSGYQSAMQNIQVPPGTTGGTPQPAGPATGSPETASVSLLAQIVDKLDQLNFTSQAQVGVSKKILQQAV